MLLACAAAAAPACLACLASPAARPAVSAREAGGGRDAIAAWLAASKVRIAVDVYKATAQPSRSSMRSAVPPPLSRPESWPSGTGTVGRTRRVWALAESSSSRHTGSSDQIPMDSTKASTHPRIATHRRGSSSGGDQGSTSSSSSSEARGMAAHRASAHAPIRAGVGSGSASTPPSACDASAR